MDPKKATAIPQQTQSASTGLKNIIKTMKTRNKPPRPLYMRVSKRPRKLSEASTIPVN